MRAINRVRRIVNRTMVAAADIRLEYTASTGVHTCSQLRQATIVTRPWQESNANLDQEERRRHDLRAVCETPRQATKLVGEIKHNGTLRSISYNGDGT